MTYIYAANNLTSTKIGITGNIERRMKELGLNLYYTQQVANPRVLEKACHIIFFPKRDFSERSREHFSIKPKDAEKLIKELNSKITASIFKEEPKLWGYSKSRMGLKSVVLHEEPIKTQLIENYEEELTSLYEFVDGICIIYHRYKNNVRQFWIFKDFILKGDWNSKTIRGELNFESVYGEPLDLPWFFAKCLKNKDIKFTWLQMAAYTEPFNTKHEMLSSLITLKTVYETPVSKFEGSSLKNYGVANYLQGRVISNNESSGDACEETAKGFAFTRKYSNKSMFTLGFYDKAGWEGEDLGALNNAIRLDLTLFKAAFVPLSKGMGFVLPSDFKMSSGDLKIFFEKVFDLDITGGVLFSTVLVNWMKIEDLFLVKKQQWETCFELLKEKRQYGFLSVLQEGKAFTTAVQENTLNAKTNAPFDDKAFATRLSNLCSTDTVKFDPTFNYPVWRAARNTLYRMFIDEEELLSWFEETPSNYSPKNQSKIGRLAAKSIAEKMRHGKLMTIDSVLDISGKAGKIKSTFDEVPF